MTIQKQRPGDLMKKIKRLKASRDELKNRGREKNLLNQTLRDRGVEIKESRDLWRAKSKELGHQNNDLQRQLDVARKELAKERERANQLQKEIEEIREKKRRIGAINP
jgi:chromosome segregation ATPase